MLDTTMDATAATVMTVSTTGSKTPALTHSVHRMRLNSEIWFISRPSMKTVWDLRPVRNPSAANSGRVANSSKAARPTPSGRASTIS